MDNILAGMGDFDTPRWVEPDRKKAIRLAMGLLEEGDTLLLAGKGHETYQEKNGKKYHLDEREEVAQADSQRGRPEVANPAGT
jgi:UDP-N-acetylmuramoyl-L-alanyl-D-glutamate--2,6-diaminopimelate ligase